MNTAMSQKELEELLDKAVRAVTEQSVGIQLYQGGDSLGNDVCTVLVSFNKGVNTSLTLCADTTLMNRMAQNVFGEELDEQDLEDFTKEYFNVLCGKIAGFLKETTHIAARFSVPVFFKGAYVPEDYNAQFVLTYSDDQHKSVQLIHHIPHSQGV